jgi:hypothetical protein
VDDVDDDGEVPGGVDYQRGAEALCRGCHPEERRARTAPYPPRPEAWLRVGDLREAIESLRDDAPIAIDGWPALVALAHASDAVPSVGTDPAREVTASVLIISSDPTYPGAQMPSAYGMPHSDAWSPPPCTEGGDHFWQASVCIWCERTVEEVEGGA